MEWFSLLENSAFIQPYLNKIPVLAFKPMRAYMSTRWNLVQRKKVIWDTYHLLERYPVFCHTLLHTSGLVMARYHVDNFGEFSFVLCDCQHSTSKEGELMVKLINNSLKSEVFKIIFSFEQTTCGAFICYIGCIQGSGTDNREEIRAITKAMHGLRPTSLMIFVVREIINAMGIEMVSILGSSNQIHPFRKKHLIHLPFAHDISFNYDALWTEAGGVPREDGWFILPLRSDRREISEVKSKKKMLYKRRYAMMDDISKQIHEKIRGSSRSPSAA